MRVRKLSGALVFLAITLAVSAGRATLAQVPTLKPGDRAVVKAETVDLVMGQKVLTKLTRGQTVVVSLVQGSWIGCEAEQHGQKVRGWVPAAALGPAPAPRPTPPRTATRTKPAVRKPGEAPGESKVAEKRQETTKDVAKVDATPDGEAQELPPRDRKPDQRVEEAQRFAGGWSISTQDIASGPSSDGTFKVETASHHLLVFRPKKSSGGGTFEVSGLSGSPSDRAFLDFLGVPARSSFEIASGADAKAIDFVPTDGHKFFGIYEFRDANTLRLSTSNRVRPTSYDTSGAEQGEFRCVLTLKRASK
jgi:hypothetical protein